MPDVNGPPRPPLLVFADDWGRHPSSCQHLIRRLRGDFRILWVNTVGTRRVRADALTLRRGMEKLRNWRKGLGRAGDRMWVVDLPMIPSLENRLALALNSRLVSWRLRRLIASLEMEEPLLLTTLPYIGWLTSGLRCRATIYYCTDDYSHWPSADRETLRRADRELSRDADLILSASFALHERHDGSGRSRYFPHGVDHAHFASAQAVQSIPDDLVNLPAPRIGFFGLIYEKLDFELIAALAAAFPRASIVMIGSVANCPDWFGRLSNVHMIGPRTYDELPRYISGLDVLLLPYLADDPMIRLSGPLKLRECLASGKPTVSVDVPEVRGLQPHVRVASSRESFLDHVREALEEPSDSDRVGARQRAVEQDDWDRRSELLRSYLEGLASAAGTVGS